MRYLLLYYTRVRARWLVLNILVSYSENIFLSKWDGSGEKNYKNCLKFKEKA